MLNVGLCAACLQVSRGLIRVYGPQALEFLQGMATNDMRLLEALGAPPVYAAVLTPKGKVLADLMVYRQEGSGGDGGSEPVSSSSGSGTAAGAATAQSLLVEVDASDVAPMLSLLRRYKLKRSVGVDDASGEWAVWAAFDGRGTAAALAMVGGGSGASGGGLAAPSAASALPPMPSGPPPGTLGGTWHVDPRLPELGWRGVFRRSSGGGSDSVSGGSADASASGQGGRSGDSSDQDAYRAWRYVNGVAEGTAEMGRDKAVPLEYSLDALHGVSYTKGCYVGQERVSYSHYRGIIRRRCVPFVLSGGGAVPAGVSLVGADVGVEGGSGSGGGVGGDRAVGSIRGVVVGSGGGGVGLALLRLPQALAAEAGEVMLAPVGVEGVEGVHLVPFRPRWWAPEWGREEGEAQQERGQQ
ncbi:hypothetical protein FOA52_004517 [Chlamydomonas sp. UWO 241]|nr:hypothetical protein FOA52_004517 [Chlamydomonas sp. UWO 241]